MNSNTTSIKGKLLDLEQHKRLSILYLTNKLSIMTIQFQHPPVTNPFINFDPSNDDHYPEGAGVYIYGLRLNVDDDDEKKFVPLCVGESSNLNIRLFNDHYNTLKVGGNNHKELFYLKPKTSISDVRLLYADLLRYDRFLFARNKHTLIKTIAAIDSLIWYQFRDFFHHKLNVASPNEYFNIPNPSTCKHSKEGVKNDLEGHSTTLKDFSNFINKSITTTSEAKQANELLEKIKTTKENFTNNFYYVYATNEHVSENTNIDLSSSDGSDRKKVEKAIKQKLEGLGIYTTANARGAIVKFNLDLTKIQNILINVGHNYGNPYTKLKI